MDVVIGVVVLVAVIAVIVAIRVSITTKAAEARSAREKEAAAHFLADQSTVSPASAQPALDTPAPPEPPAVARYGVDDPPPPPPPGW